MTHIVRAIGAANDTLSPHMKALAENGQKSIKELEIIRHGQVEGLSVFFDTVDYRTPHFHPEWELIWVLEQSLLVAYANKRILVKPGELLLFSANQTHELHRVDQSCTFLCFQFLPSYFTAAQALIAESPFPRRFLSDDAVRDLKAALREAAEAYFTQRPNYELLCIGRISLAFYQLLRAMPFRQMTREESACTGRRNTRLAALLDFVDQNYMRKCLLSDFSAREGCSVSYLSHFVKEALNQTFQQYVASVRLNAACKLIASGNQKLLDICYASGFSDYRYFSKAFKRQFAMTPQQYSRKEARIEPAGTSVHHSIHSLERFYSREQSKTLLYRLLAD